MAERTVDYLLIGGGIAAASCARTLREEGADGSILVIGREADPPYSRPPLSKEYLAGKADRDAATYRPPEWWEENDVELLTRTSAMKLDADARTVKLATRAEVGFDKALIATGANVFRLKVEGSDRKGIHYLRSFGNSDAIRSAAEDAERVLLIGGSYIACEVAATLASSGRRCSMLMQEEVTLERQFGKEIGGFFQRLLEDHGVEVHGRDGLGRYEGSERVEKVVSERGVEIDCDLVVVGCGIMPDVMLARSGGLELGDAGGVRCSATLETSVPGVFAAGDMAEWDSPLHDGPVRIEHEDVAIEHGKTAAHNMLGRERPHEVVPYFWSDLSDWATLEYVGAGSGDERVVRGSIDEGRFTAFSLDGGRVVSAATVGRSEDLDPARALIRERKPVDAAALGDADTPLDELLGNLDSNQD